MPLADLVNAVVVDPTDSTHKGTFPIPADCHADHDRIT